MCVTHSEFISVDRAVIRCAADLWIVLPGSQMRNPSTCPPPKVTDAGPALTRCCNLRTKATVGVETIDEMYVDPPSNMSLTTPPRPSPPSRRLR